MAGGRTSQRGVLVFLIVCICVLAGSTAWLAWLNLRDSDGFGYTGRGPALPSLHTEPDPDEEDMATETENAQVYFLSRDRKMLVPKSRAIPKTQLLQERLHKVVDVLIAGPMEDDVLPVLPSTTRLRGLFWDSQHGMVVVDLSDEVLTDHPGQFFSEWATVYGITTSLAAQDKRIKAVQILVEGEIVENRNTTWDWSAPFEPEKVFVPLGA